MGDIHEFEYDGVQFFVDFVSQESDALVIRYVYEDDFRDYRQSGTYELLENAESGDITAFVEVLNKGEHVPVGFAVPDDSLLSVEDILGDENRSIVNAAVGYLTGVPGYGSVGLDG